VRLPESEFLRASEFTGKPVLLGVRPEEIGITEAAAPEKYAGDFPALIDHVERTGSETYLHLRTGSHTLMGRIPAGVSVAEAGHRGRFMLNRNRLCLFDPVSKRRIGQQA
jgi:multiple sugar transport system ATP-binding protein